MYVVTLYINYDTTNIRNNIIIMSIRQMFILNGDLTHSIKRRRQNYYYMSPEGCQIGISWTTILCLVQSG